jgi:hypothetical protein
MRRTLPASYVRTLLLCAVILLQTMLCALYVVTTAHLKLGDVVTVYLLTGLAVTLVGTPIWLLFITIRNMLHKVQKPLLRLQKRLRLRLPLLLFPAFVMPIFLVFYTMAKTGIGRLTAFSWDAPLAALDRTLFFGDPQAMTRAMFAPPVTTAIEWAYMLWGLLLVFVPLCMALISRSRLVATFFPALMLVWFLGGVCLAYALASAGPALVVLLNHAGDPALAAAALPAGDPIRMTQAYLVSNFHSDLVVHGGGISAMPSMHVATTAVFVMAARRTAWFWPAVVFAVIIWVGSIHLGYHYSTGGIVGAALAYGCWRAVEILQARGAAMFQWTGARPSPEPVE